MRRRASLVLLSFAVSFAAMAPTLRWYAFPRLAKVPPNQYQEVVLEARPATLLDYTTLTSREVEKIVKMREDYIADTVELVSANRTTVLLLVSRLPWTFTFLALVLLALALGLEHRSRRPAPGTARPPAPRPAPEPVTPPV